jgi:predicted unusual protein kinase regulating ubiquinone biosynthesis (AarF/ABC1/UbiB family)
MKAPKHAPEGAAAPAQKADEAARTGGPLASSIDRSRYRRVRWFFLRVILHAFWWDLVLARPMLRRWRRPAIDRWRELAREYRSLAVELGGVLIKLGQFLSTRVDVIPLEITRELSGLQDEVPPEPFPEIVSRIEADFGRPADEVFAWISPIPSGAASLAQVHRARMANGREVVVKVLRPAIEVLVETDLQAIRQATRWLRLSRRITRRVDVAWIHREFVDVTRRELDLISEGHNAERFAEDFRDDSNVVVPQIYWDHTTTHVLTMEDVAHIKIGDLEALDAAGIDRSLLASRLYGVYMRQFFVTHFVHADPHPGNIFVRPLPAAEAPDDESEDAAAADCPFEIVFVDFGMMTEIPERLRRGLREFAIGLGTRDAHRMVQSYVTAGVVLPGANLSRLEAAHADLLERFWGVSLGSMREVALEHASDLMLEYSDILFNGPLQVQADMLFALRAVGILAGLTTTLDPQFDPWSETMPFAQRFAEEEHGGRLRSWLDEVGTLAQAMLKVPPQLDRLLGQVERGTFGVQTSFSTDAAQRVEQLERSVDRLSWMVAAAALLFSGTMLRVTDARDPLATIAFALAAIAFLLGIRRKH